jgi:hypothetical protein
MRACLRFSLLDSKESASSVLGEEVSVAGKGSSSSSAEIAGLSTAVVGNERTFG